MTLADMNCTVYTREADGTIQKWYVCGWCGPNFAVSPVRNARSSDYKRYYHMNEVGKTVFLNRRDIPQMEG